MTQLDWNATIESLRETLPRAQFQNWFKPLRLIRSDDTRVVLGVPNRFHEEWLKNNYGDQLSRICDRDGEKLQLEFELFDHAQSSSPTESTEETAKEEPTSSTRPNLRVIDRTEAAPEELDAPIEKPNLPKIEDKFIEMDYNRIAYQCSQLFVSGNSGVNPLILYGGIGMGKTHLLTEVGKQLHAMDPNLRIRYTNFESFTGEMVQSLQTNTNQAFKRKYRDHTDVLLFDDVHGLTKRKRSQEELLHIFNELLGQGKRVAFTLSIAPQNLENFIEPLRSRLLSGVIADFKDASYDDRVALVEKKCELDGINMDPTALRTFAAQGHRDIRELMGSLIRVHVQAKLENKTVNQEYLGENTYLAEPRRESITMEEIVSFVENYLGVSRSEMMSKSRKGHTVWARQVAMFLARHYTLHSLEQIGKTFGRDHATVVHAFSKVQETIASKPNRRYEVEFLKKKIASATGSPRNV